MITTVEGIYRHGKIELFNPPIDISESRVLITFLPQTTSHTNNCPLTYGQFAGEKMSTEEDFSLAEWPNKAEHEHE